MGYTLFNPNGRIGSREFVMGALVLLAIQFLFHLSPLISWTLFTIMLFVWFASLYCWIALFAKRFHDAGKTGALFIAVLLPWLIVGYFIWSFTLGLFSDLSTLNQITALSEEYQATQNEDVAMEMMSMFGGLIKGASIGVALVMFLYSGAIAFGVNALLKSEPGANEHGPNPNQTSHF